MKEINELNLPNDVGYTEDHEWARLTDGTVVIGISDYAQDQLGDITFVELPAVGDSFQKGEEFGTLESVKAVSEMFIPIGGEIIAINEELGESPELINQAPYGKGWLVEVQPQDPKQMDSMKTSDEYVEMLRGFE